MEAQEPYIFDPFKLDYVDHRLRQLVFVGLSIAAFIVLPCFTLIVGGIAAINSVELIATGISTAAKVVDKRVTNDIRDNKTYYIRYEYFTDDNQRYERERTVNKETYDRLEIGSTIDIVYARNNPKHSDFVRTTETWLFVAVATICWMTFAGLWIVWGVRRIHKWLHTKKAILLMRGQEVAGQIIACDVHKDSDETEQITAEYRFISPESGASLTGKVTHSVEYFEGETLPETGMPVRVLYASDDIYEVM